MGKRIKLTKAVIEGMNCEKDGQWVTDSEVPQLVIRLTPTAKTYVARWWSKTSDRKRQEKIARFGEISVADARDRTRKLVAEDRPRQVETLGNVFEEWERSYASTISAAHADEFRRTWKKHIEADLGSVKLSRLSNGVVQGWYNKKRQEHPVSAKGTRRNAPYSADTVKRWVAYISKLCTIARKNGWMLGNPCESLEMSTLKRRLDIFSRDDIKKLGENLKAVDNRYPVGVALLRFLMIFPCRGIEARDMQWADVDLVEGTWTIPADRYKTKQDKVFPLGPLQRDHLRSLPKWSDQYVFPRPSGSGIGSSRCSTIGTDLPVTKNHQIYVWGRVRPKPLGAHALRKTFGHLMINNQVPLEVVSKLMGHSNTIVTQQAYAHLDPQVAAKYLADWTRFIEDEDAVPDDWVGPVLEAHARNKVAEFNAK